MADDPVTVRPGGRNDVERGLRVWAAAHERRRGTPPPTGHVDRVRRHFDGPDAFWVVAERGDGLAGMALAMPALADDGKGLPLPGRCHVSAVFVNPAHWNRGIGGLVVDALLAHARTRGYRAAQLWTQATNDRALRLYEHRGFVRTGREAVVDDERIVQLATADEPGP